MLSYWEKQHLIHYDHIVVGGGIVGLNLAIELRERFPQRSVLVLERGLLPYGASTRNAGFACMGSVTELLDDLQTTGTDEVASLFARRKQGLELLRQRLGDNNIGYEDCGSYELLGRDEIYALDHVATLNTMLMPYTGTAAFSIATGQVNQFGFSPSYCKALIRNNLEGSLHTGKMMHALGRLAQLKGVEIKTGANVTGITEEHQHATVVVNGGNRQDDICFSAKQVCVCTNAFTRSLFPDEDVIPGRGQVLITQPIEDLPIRGIFHFDKGYYYFREIDGRVLFGGGRNLDPEGETTTELELNETIHADLEEKLRTIILPGRPFEIDMRWSGIMAFGKDKQPIVKKISTRVSGAYKMGGMGVAIGCLVARQLADMIEGSQRTS